MKKKICKRMLIFIVLSAVCLACFATSCEYLIPPPQTPSVSSVVSPARKRYPTDGGLKSVMETNSLKFIVNDAELMYEIGGEVPESDTLSFLRVNITVINKDEPSLPVGASDFSLYIGEGKDEKPLLNLFGANDIATKAEDEAFPISYDMNPLETITGDIYFQVAYGQTQFALKHTEAFAIDENTLENGDTYIVTFYASLQDESLRLLQNRKYSSVYDYNTVILGKAFETSEYTVNIRGFTVDKETKRAEARITVTIRSDFVNSDGNSSEVLTQGSNIEFTPYGWSLRYGINKADSALPLGNAFQTEKGAITTVLVQPGETYSFKLIFALPTYANAYLLEFEEMSATGRAVFAIAN